MKLYSNFEEIKYDLNKLSLERKIAIEELKVLKGDFQDSMQPMQWVQSVGKVVAKLGAFIIAKKAVNKATR